MKYLKTHRKHHPNISQLAQLLPTPQHFQMDWAENRVPHSILWFIIIFLIKNTWLVVSTPLKNMKVNWDYYSQYMESHKKCSKPPTSYHLDVSKSEEKLKKIVGFISQNSPITNINHQHVLVYIVGISQ